MQQLDRHLSGILLVSLKGNAIHHRDEFLQGSLLQSFESILGTVRDCLKNLESHLYLAFTSLQNPFPCIYLMVERLPVSSHAPGPCNLFRCLEPTRPEDKPTVKIQDGARKMCRDS